MKKYVENKSEETTDELTNWVGIELSNLNRGAILCFGDNRYHIITNEDFYGNRYYGGIDYDGCNVKDALDKVNDHLCTIYCFDSYKELMTWFVKGMKD